jgi:hypothetical protein
MNYSPKSLIRSRRPRSSIRPLRFRPSLEQFEPRLTPSDVLSWRGNLPGNNSGANLQETQLTPLNVNPGTFGLQVTYPVDGQIYGQPLVKTGVSIGGVLHDVVFVVTEHDSVYAFDAANFGGANTSPLWHDSFLTSGLPGATAITTVPSSVTGSADITPEIGITATPTIDRNTGTLYIVSKTQETVGGVNHYVQRLHALDITSGAEKFGGPVVLGDTTFGGPDGGFTDLTPIMVPGTGDSSDGTTVHFNALRENERDGLFLSGSILYMTFTSHGDTTPYHGWLVGYNPLTLQLVSVYNTTPNGTEGAIWMGGGSPAVDGNGNIFFATGNGTFDAGPDYGMSTEKVSPTPIAGTNQLPVLTFFAPHDEASLSAVDLDQGSGGVLLLPTSAGGLAHPQLLVQTGKTGRIYLLDRNNLGGFTPTDGGAVQILPDGTINGGSYDTPAFFYNGSQQLIYYMGQADALKSFEIASGQIMPKPFAQTNQVFGFPGANPMISANGTSNGIVWVLDDFLNGTGGHPNSGPAVLHAYNATTLQELYNSSQNGLLDQLGNAVKFTVPTVANGKVYVGTQTGLYVFGLFTATAVPAAPEGLSATATSGTSINLSWINEATNARAVRIFRSTGDSSTFVQIALVKPDTTTFTDKTVTPSTKYFYRVAATNALGDSNASNTANATTPIAPSVLSITGTGSSQVNLAWTAMADNHYNVLRSTDGTHFSVIANVSANVKTFSDSGLAPGVYYYQVEGFNQNSQTAFSNIVRDTVGEPVVIDHSAGFTNNSDLTANGSATFYPNATPVGIFAGHQDVGTQGDPSPTGSTTFANGAYTLTASGSDIWTNTDHMQYAYKPLVGDGSIIARLVSASAPDFWTKAGVMIRDSLTAGAADDFMLDTPNPSHQEPVMQFRDADNGQTADSGNHFTSTTPNVPTPIWLRLDRVGNTFTGYWAVDNSGTPGVWNLMSQSDPHTTFMPTTVFVGLALTAHSNGNVATATFDHVTVTGTTAPLPPAVAGLTDGGFGEAGTVFTDQKADIRSFTTTFTFQMSGGTTPFGADGLSFIIQGNSATALGGAGGGLGYQGIGNSVAITFRAFAGPFITFNGIFVPTSYTELGENGQFVASNSLTAANINFNAGSQDSPPDVYSVTLSYSGTTLTETLRDTNTGATFTTSYANVNIPSLVGGDLAYVGFGGGTGGLSLVDVVQTWTFTPTTQNLAPLAPSNLVVASVAPHDANRNDITITWVANSFNETGYEVWRSTNGTTFTQIATLPPNSMSFTDSMLGAGTYYYKVRAFNANGASSFTNVDSVITATPGATATVNHSAGFNSNGDLTANGSTTFAQFAYQLDDGSSENNFNNSQGVETEDNWVANSFQIAPGTQTLTGIQFLLSGNYTSRAITALIYTGTSLTDPHAGSGLTLISETDTTFSGTNGSFVTIPLAAPLTLPMGQVFWAALLMRGVPGNQFPFNEDLDNPLGRSWFDVGPTQGGAYNVNNTSNARVFGATDHPVVPGGVQPPGNLMLRVNATGPAQPVVARLTDGGFGEAGSVFTTSRVGVTNFSTTFNFRMHDGTTPSADGMAFVIQSDSPSALGGTGGGLGYGSDTPNGPVFIPNSIAIKFDLFSNAGEGIDSTGLFTNGASPTVGVNPGDVSIDLTGTGIDLHSQDVFQVTLAYDGTRLTETITDETLASHPSFTHSYMVNIAADVGSVGYLGFSGGTGGLTTVADVQTWTYSFTQPEPAVNATAGGSSPGASPLAPAGVGETSSATVVLEPTGDATLAAALPRSANAGLSGNTQVAQQQSYGSASSIDSGLSSASMFDSVTINGDRTGGDHAGYRRIGTRGGENPLVPNDVLDEVFGTEDLIAPF